MRALLDKLGLLFIILMVTSLSENSSSQVRSPIVWDPEIRLSFDGLNNVTPRVLAQGDTVHVIWHHARTMYTRSTDAGLTWSQPVNIHRDTLINGGDKRRDVAVTGPFVYTVWTTCDTCGPELQYWVTFRRSTNAGVDFEPYQRLFRWTAGAMTAYDSTIAFVYSTEPPGERRLALSFDAGLSWVTKPLVFHQFQHPFLASDRLHMVQMAEGTPTLEVSYMRSNDFGTTWEQEVLMSTPDMFPSQDAQLTGGVGGNLFLVWLDGKYGSSSGFSGSALLRRSTDNGLTWGAEARLSEVPSAGGVRVALSTNMVAVVWGNEPQALIFPKISLRLSTDGGANWCQEIAVADSGIRLLFPDVAVANSRVHVVWVNEPGGVRQVYYRRGRIITTDVLETIELRDGMHLFPNYPNPFNSQTTISFALERETELRLSVIDILGREVALLFEGKQGAGIHSTRFYGERHSTGMYFIILQIKGRREVRPILLLK